MEQQNQIDIKRQSTEYDIELTYHSGLKCADYDAKIIGIDWHNGKISLRSPAQWNILGPANNFTFDHSDPDRIIAIAQMMIAFAQMVKNENKKGIDTSADA